MRTIKGVTLTDNQASVYEVLKARGPMPDHALVPLAQHMLSVHQSSSGIRSRRAELVDAGLVKVVDYVPTASGRLAGVWKAL